MSTSDINLEPMCARMRFVTGSVDLGGFVSWEGDATIDGDTTFADNTAGQDGGETLYSAKRPP